VRGVVACALAASVALAQVPYYRLTHPDPESWLTYSGNYSSYRYSPLTQIDSTNTAKLRLQWMYQSKDTTRFETSPVVVDGVMYVTESPSDVAALDVHSGRTLWRYERPMPKDLRTLGFGR